MVFQTQSVTVLGKDATELFHHQNPQQSRFQNEKTIRAPRFQLLWNNEEDENTEVATCGCRFNNSGRSQPSFYTYWLYLPALCGFDLFPPLVMFLSITSLHHCVRDFFFLQHMNSGGKQNLLKETRLKKRRVCSGFYSNWLLDPGVHFATITEPLIQNNNAYKTNIRTNIKQIFTLQVLKSQEISVCLCCGVGQ